MDNTHKQYIFISHANPHDNDATLWLASKLTLEGYSVWSDVTQLFGGEVFWDDIEDVIRNYSIKVLALISQNSQHAQGVLDEIALATQLERRHIIQQFVIPIKLDELPFEELRVNLTRKNVIDFSHDWTKGLEKLLKRLSLDGVKKQNTANPNAISNWFTTNYAKSTPILQQEQEYSSNWIRITRLPTNIHFSRSPVKEESTREIIKHFRYPGFVLQQLIGSYANSKELQPYMPQYAVLLSDSIISTHDFIRAISPKFPNLKWQDSQNIYNHFLKNVWSNFVLEKGLIPYTLSNSNCAWYLPYNTSTTNFISYIDTNGTKRKKKLVGHSARYNVYWHYGVSVHPSFSYTNRFTLKSHIIFTQDGIKPIESKDRMHTLRRSFCKSWWNEQWRILLLAYLSYLAKGEDFIKIDVSPTEYIEFDSTPCLFQSQFTIDETSINSPNVYELNDTNEFDYDEQTIDFDLDENEFEIDEEEIEQFYLNEKEQNT